MAASTGMGRFPNQMPRVTRDTLSEPGAPAVPIAVNYFFGGGAIVLTPMSRIQQSLG